MYSRQVILPTKTPLTNVRNERDDEINLKNSTMELNNALENSHEMAWARAEKVEIKMSVRHDQSQQNVEFRKGDLVLVYNPHKKLRTTNKSNNRFYVPFKDIAKM